MMLKNKIMIHVNASLESIADTRNIIAGILAFVFVRIVSI